MDRLALILGLGGYLATMALAKGESIVAVVLCPMALIGVIALALACLHFPRISHRGRAYLEQLELAYDLLTSKGRRRGRSRSAGTKAGDPDDWEPMRESSVYSDRLLMDGIFGEVSPAETPLTALETAMFPDGRFLGEEDTTVESAAAIWERGKTGRSGRRPGLSGRFSEAGQVEQRTHLDGPEPRARVLGREPNGRGAVLGQDQVVAAQDLVCLREGAIGDHAPAAPYADARGRRRRVERGRAEIPAFVGESPGEGHGLRPGLGERLRPRGLPGCLVVVAEQQERGARPAARGGRQRALRRQSIQGDERADLDGPFGGGRQARRPRSPRRGRPGRARSSRRAARSSRRTGRR